MISDQPRAGCNRGAEIDSFCSKSCHREVTLDDFLTCWQMTIFC